MQRCFFDRYIYIDLRRDFSYLWHVYVLGKLIIKICKRGSKIIGNNTLLGVCAPVLSYFNIINPFAHKDELTRLIYIDLASNLSLRD